MKTFAEIMKNEKGGATIAVVVVLFVVGLIAFFAMPNLRLAVEDGVAHANTRVGGEVSLEHIKNEVLGEISDRESQITLAYAELGQLKAYVKNAKVSLTESEKELIKTTSILKRGRTALLKANGGTLVIGGRKHTSAEVMNSLEKKVNKAESLRTTIASQKTHLASLENGYDLNVAAIKEAKSKLGEARAKLQRDIAILVSGEELQKVKAMLAQFDVRDNLIVSNQSAAQKELNRRMMRIEANTEYGKLDSDFGDAVNWNEEVTPSDVLGRINAFLDDGLTAKEIGAVN